MASQSAPSMMNKDRPSLSFVVPLLKTQNGLPVPPDHDEPRTKPIYRHWYSKITILLLLGSTKANKGIVVISDRDNDIDLQHSLSGVREYINSSSITFQQSPAIGFANDE